MRCVKGEGDAKEKNIFLRDLNCYKHSRYPKNIADYFIDNGKELLYAEFIL